MNNVNYLIIAAHVRVCAVIGSTQWGQGLSLSSITLPLFSTSLWKQQWQPPSLEPAHWKCHIVFVNLVPQVKSYKYPQRMEFISFAIQQGRTCVFQFPDMAIEWWISIAASLPWQCHALSKTLSGNSLIHSTSQELLFHRSITFLPETTYS